MKTKHILFFALIINTKAYTQSKIENSYKFAKALMHNEQYAQALVSCDSLLNALATDKTNDFYAKTLLNKQIIFINLNNYNKSVELGLEAYKLFVNKNDSVGQSKICSNLANTYFLMGDYQQAIKYASEAINYLDKLKYKKGISNSFNTIAISYERLRDTTKALIYYKKSLVCARYETDSVLNKLSVYSNIFDVYIARNDYKKADSLIKLTRVLIEKNKNILNQSTASLANKMQVEYYIKTKDYNKALAIQNNELNYINNKDFEDKIYYYKNLSLCYTEKNQLDSVVKYLILTQQATDSLYANSNLASTNNLTSNFEIEKREIIFNQKLLYEKSLRKSIIVACSIVFIIIAFFLLLVYYQLKKQKQLTSKVENQAFELKQKQKEIVDSINYAKRIQMAIMPNINLLSKYLKR